MDFEKPGPTAEQPRRESSRGFAVASERIADRSPPIERSIIGAAYSAVVGWSAERKLPSPLRAAAYRAFARAVGANLAEAELELSAYPSLGDFFARKLRDGMRVVDARADAIVSPCDGVVAARGAAVDGALVQAKGITYSLAELLAGDALARRLVGGDYVTIYLSPRDYHRVHAPLAGRIVAYEFVPGALWPVNPRVAARREALLARNERVVIHMNCAGIGDVAVVMVGASGVGNIVLANGMSSAALRGSVREPLRVEVDEPVARGGELGAFRLGSTVVLVLPPNRAMLRELAVGSAVRFGELIGGVR